MDRRKFGKLSLGTVAAAAGGITTLAALPDTQPAIDDPALVHMLRTRGVETGNLSVNSHSSVRYWTPFGGFKQSGLGRELGPDALDAFTETKNVFIATDE